METDIAQISLSILKPLEASNFSYRSGHLIIVFSRKGSYGFEYMGRRVEHALPPYSNYMMCMQMGDFELNFFGSSEAMIILDLPLPLLHQLVLDEELNISFSEHAYLKEHMIHKLGSNNARVEAVLDQIISADDSQRRSPLFMQSKKLDLLSSFFEIEAEKGQYECPFLNYQDNVAKVREAKKILLADLKESIPIKELARRVGLNESHLKSGFKEIYGKPIYQYYKRFKNEYAKKELERKEVSVSLLASDLGYSNVSHFIESFKKQFGITPKQYQMRMHK